MLDILYVMDPMPAIMVDKDTTFVFMLESQGRGGRNYHCLPSELSVLGGKVVARCRPVHVQRQVGAHFELGPEESREVDAFDCVMMRKDPPFNMAYVFATYLLELVSPRTLVMNRPDSLRSANEKLYALQFPAAIPPSIVTTDRHEIRVFGEQMGGMVVIKPLDGAGGEGVFLLRLDDPNFNVIAETVTGHGTRWAMVQRYIPEIRTKGDKRIILLDGRPLGAIARVPQPGELRGNIHVGGRVEKAGLTARDQEICELVGPRLRRDGLWFVGLDVIGDFLTEVNVTSPTGIQEIDRLDGVKLEATVMDFVEAECARRRSS